MQCGYCRKNIEPDFQVLEHEYGQIYCSYPCLCLGGFYGHFMSYRISEKQIKEREEEDKGINPYPLFFILSLKYYHKMY